MTREEFDNTQWHKGMRVRMNSAFGEGRIFLIRGVDFKRRWLDLTLLDGTGFYANVPHETVTLITEVHP